MSVLAPIAVHVLAVLAATAAVFVFARMAGHSLVGTHEKEGAAADEDQATT